jgi:quinol monooxygenase YgiN
MSVMTVRAKVKEENVADVEAAAEKVFTAIDQQHAGNVRYASCKLADGVTFVVLLQVTEGTENPLPALPEFQEFQENLKTWMAEPPVPEQLTVVGSYRLFD